MIKGSGMKGTGTPGLGRRKNAVARVYLRPAKSEEGQILVNGKTYTEYFGRQTSVMIVDQPLQLLDVRNKYDVVVNVRGGGKSGQAGAVRHAISRALLELGDDFRAPLKKAGYLTRDSREVERKKYGRHKARRRPQYSKR